MSVKPPVYQVYVMKGKEIKAAITFDDIHIDDTIGQIKQKIIGTLSEATKNEATKNEGTPSVAPSVAPSGPLYLCAQVNHQINLSNVILSQQPHAFEQLLANLEIENEADPTNKKRGIQDSGLKHGEIRPIMVGLGMKLEPFDYVFPADPLSILPTTNIAKYVPLLSHSDDSILLSSGDIVDNIIYAHFAEDVLENAKEMGIVEKDILSVYFPEGNTNVGVKNQMIDFLYETYYTRSANQKQKYLERGIHQYDISLFSENRALFSLDAIFKNIHCTREMPFIRYKPGVRRDPIYRLYSTQVTRTGKRIPMLSSKRIGFLINASSNYKHISIYNDKHNIFIHIENDGTIRIQGKIMKNVDDKRAIPSSASISEVDELLDAAVNPFLTMLNQYLSKSGYKVPLFTSIESAAVKINNLMYVTAFNVKSQFVMNNACSYSIFDSASTNILRFKRVDNFKKMDAQSALISEVYKKTGSDVAVIEALMNNYKMSNKEAILRFIDYKENLNYAGNQRAIERTNMFSSIKNPGFLTTIDERKISEDKREIRITVSNLTNIKYIETLTIYIDSLLYLSQTDDAALKDKCNAIVEEDEEEEKIVPSDENIEEPKQVDVQKAQPVDINRLINQLENPDTEGEGEADDADIDLDDFLESASEGDDADFYETDDDESLMGGGGPATGGGPALDEDDRQGIEDVENALQESEYNTTSKAKKKFIRKLKEHDPKLFSFTQTKSGQFKHYTRVCQAMLQPVVLTQEEKKKIDENYRGSYTEAVEYGTTEENKNWYICPRFWCFKTNTSMTKEDIDAGKCGKTKAEIKENVFEFSASKEHKNKLNGEYVKHYPGFKQDIHPDGYCLPCCFSEWDTQLHKDRRAQCTGNAPPVVAPAAGPKEQQYIIGADKISVDPGRWGFVQYAAQHFLQIDYKNHVNKMNPSIIRERTATLLRYGIQQETQVQPNGNKIEMRNRSIVACFADIYARSRDSNSPSRPQPTPSVSEFLQIVADAITIDVFVQYGNGSYMTTFSSEDLEEEEDEDLDEDYLDSRVYKFLDMRNRDHFHFFKKLKTAYRKFKQFLLDPASTIDHSYFWDIVAMPNPRLFPRGINIVLMEITNNDVTENVDIICPTNAYSAYQFREDRESAFIIKSNDLYSPIYKYTSVGKEEPVVVPLLTSADFPLIYKSLSSIIGNYCKPQASIGKKYSLDEVELKQPMLIVKLALEVSKMPYTIEKQIWNYQGKVVALLLRANTTNTTVIVPCHPSAPIVSTDKSVLDATFMDDARIFGDYATTKAELVKLATLNPLILCRPVAKIVELSKIVGILTETNQVVRIKTPQDNVEDNLMTLGENNYLFYEEMAKTVETAEEGDPDRIRIVRNVTLEDEFYSLFRTTLKSVLESSSTSLMRIAALVKSRDTTLEAITQVVREIMEPAVVFGKHIDNDILDDLYEKGALCSKNGTTNGTKNGSHIGLITDDSKCVFPETNLVDESRKNSHEYFVRIADEILRYGHLRNFIMKPQVVLNAQSDTYKVNADEYIVIESDLMGRDYFTDMVPYNRSSYANGIPYEMANPDPVASKKYSNEVSLEEQFAAGNEFSQIVNQCKSNIKDVYGHPVTNYWRRWVFPHGKNARKVREVYFQNSVACSYAPLIYILQSHFKELYSEEKVREMIWEGYRDIAVNMLDKILVLFDIQGKRGLAERIRRGESFEELVRRSPDYFATILDMWVVFHKYNVPVIAFSSTDELSGMGITALENPLKVAGESANAWIVMGGSAEHRQFYFVRSPSIVRNYKKDVVPEHQMIFGPVDMTEMEQLEPKLQSALLQMEYVQRKQGPEYFVQRVVRQKK